MKEYELIYNGSSSKDHDLIFSVEDLNWTKPELDASFISIPGRSGDFVESNQRYKNFEQSFTFYTNPRFKTLEEVSGDLSSWLRVNHDYVPFFVTLKPDYLFEAVAFSGMTFSRVDKYYAKVVITFNCKPFIKRIDGQQPITIDKAKSRKILNPEAWDAQPTIHAKLNGDLSITINGESYVVKGVDDEIYLDGENNLAYKDLNSPRNNLIHFPDNDYPVLTPGINTINWTGPDDASFEILPNWRTLA